MGDNIIYLVETGCSVVWCGMVWCGVVWCGVVYAQQDRI